MLDSNLSTETKKYLIRKDERLKKDNFSFDLFKTYEKNRPLVRCLVGCVE